MALKEWKRHCGKMGVPIREGCLTSINFVEDQAVIAQDVHDLVLKILYKIYKS